MGFLGLIAIAALFAVYLIRPQYKKRVISGTVVWKRVLLREKKRRPMFDHIFLFLLQALVLAIFAAGLAQPCLYSPKVLLEDAEYILVLDVSASMRARSLTDGTTRFGRAVDAAKEEIDGLFAASSEGTVSLIVADGDPAYLFSDLKKEDRAEIFGMLDALSCTLEECDLKGAAELAGKRLGDNPYAKIFLFTDTAYGDLGTAVKVVDVSDAAREQNVAVLGCNVGRQDNQYLFELIFGAYGNVSVKRNVSLDIKGADNGQGPRDLHLEVPVTFAVDENDPAREQIVRVPVFATDEAFGGQEDWFFETYEGMEISIPDLGDSIPEDDRYFVYGGVRDAVAVEYWSMKPKIFWQYGFNNLANNMGATRAISFREIYRDQAMQAANHGYDLYIFEHSVPPEILEAGLPKDGVVLLADPDETLAQTSLGLSVKETVSLGKLTPCTGSGHPLLRYMEPERIGLTEYKRLSASEDPFFETVLSVNGDPVILVKNTPSAKLVVMPFSINMSDFYGDQFQIFLYNLLDCFMPLTLQKNDFVVGERAALSCKGESIEVSCGELSETLSEFPAEYPFRSPGTYVFTTHFGLPKEDEIRRAYVHAPASESALFPGPAFRVVLDNRELSAQSGTDLFLWFAAAALVLMAAEWWIHYRYIL